MYITEKSERTLMFLLTTSRHHCLFTFTILLKNRHGLFSMQSFILEKHHLYVGTLRLQGKPSPTNIYASSSVSHRTRSRQMDSKSTPETI